MQVGGSIPLFMQLFDNATDKFIRVWVRNPSGANITGSPVDLTPGLLGAYSDYTLELPNVPFVTCQYIVYDDEEYTEISESEGSSADIIYRDPTSSGSSGPSAYPIVGVLDGSDGCPVNGIQDTIVKGSDRTLAIRFVNGLNNEPYDLTGTELVEAKFLNADDTVLTISSEDESSPIEVTDAAAGKMTVIITEEQTELLLAQTPAPFSVAITNSVGRLVCNFSYQLSIEDELV